MRIPVNEPVITAAAKTYVNEALETGWISSSGPFIGKFEEEFAKFLGVKHAMTASSGTTALHLALLALGIKEGDDVIVPAFTMIASVDAILYTGASPLFVDAEPETFNIDVTKIEAQITQRTKAIMPVHLYGHSADMDPILALAKKHKIAVVEDAAEAHGALYKRRKCGAMGTINCFSFYGNKIVTTGEGGMVVTDDDALAKRVRTLKDLAHAPGRRFWHEEVGYNYRMTNLQAACGLGQLEHVHDFLETKEWMAQAYAKGLGGIRGLRLPITKAYAENVHWMYAVVVEDGCTLSRDELCKRLAEHGIDSRPFFFSAPSMPFLSHFAQGESFPVAEDLSRRGFYLPSGLALTQDQLDAVCRAVHSILDDAA
ncbi:DegT/DnrJ/EryC1/StrS family aminotransferase [Candidatus Peregrinibacteria bacterium]|nr:DegT/DnrJ/EryC1/StrS family aminotransferase [Candidatus Peregrinibacteria bacterium]MBI3816643.1 DegT/DnrJ/EryC1/StrS family aminotransferase [Candidatus Peregrinibacteria bacterium]